MADLVRFGVAMEDDLLEDLDALVKLRGVTRSELLRDLARAEVARTKVVQGVPAVASLTLVYDHHVRDLTEKLTDLQHQLGDRVTSSLHVHLDAERCLEVVILRGRSDELQAIAERLLAMRGVTHGGVQIVAQQKAPAREKARAAWHSHDGGPPHRHPVPAGDHDHSHRTRARAKKGAAKTSSPGAGRRS